MSFPRSSRLHGFQPSFWHEFSSLAAKYNAIPLGQGFPDAQFTPELLKRAASQAVAGDNLNQYTRSAGHLRLVKALAVFYGGLLQRPVDPLAEVLVTVGGCEALHVVMQAVISPACDESVLLFEPFFDFFQFQAKIAGARPIGVPLVRTDDANWSIDFDALERAVVPGKTKLIVVNSPSNPLGKVLTFAELLRIAQFAQRHQLRIAEDSVYEHMCYDGIELVRIAALDAAPAAASVDAAQRSAIQYARANTYVIGSAGKTWSVTGWKLGWLIAPPPFIADCTIVHQYTAYTCCTPLQEALAVAFEDAAHTQHYLADLRAQLQSQRDKLFACLAQIKAITVFKPSGAYFIMVDISRVAVDELFTDDDRSATSHNTVDFVFCRWLARVVGVGAVPCTPFYSDEHAHLGERMIRFAFPKTDATIAEAIARLRTLDALLKER
jgi:aspartate/methionine/tyrosine aminotransferase